MGLWNAGKTRLGDAKRRRVVGRKEEGDEKNRDSEKVQAKLNWISYVGGEVCATKNRSEG